MQKEQIIRCGWSVSDPIYVDYHDREWGVPVHNDQELFEMIILDGAQAGLSWLTILRKRENYRRAFDDFDARKISRYGQKKMDELMSDAGIVRNRLKIEAAIWNAKAFLKIQGEFGTFDSYIWRFVGGSMRKNARRSLKEIPATTPESDAMSKDLVSRGFRFAGSTICYAFMQAAGLVNDHIVDCYRYKEVMRGTPSAR